MRILSKAEYSRLSANDKKNYDKELKAYVEAWKSANPEGRTVTARIKGLSLTPSMINGKPMAAITLDLDDDEFGEQLPNGVILRPWSNADVIARNAGFAGFSHMAIALTSHANKGQFKFHLTLNIAGDKYSTRSGAEKAFTSTHFRQEDFEYIPSPGVAAFVGKATISAVTKGYESLLNSHTNGNGPAAKPETEEEDADVTV